jgi:hypothetical protein
MKLLIVALCLAACAPIESLVQDEPGDAHTDRGRFELPRASALRGQALELTVDAPPQQVTLVEPDATLAVFRFHADTRPRLHVRSQLSSIQMPTFIVYDSKDRVVEILLPRGSTAQLPLSVESGLIVAVARRAGITRYPQVMTVDQMGYTVGLDRYNGCSDCSYFSSWEDERFLPLSQFVAGERRSGESQAEAALDACSRAAHEVAAANSSRLVEFACYRGPLSGFESVGTAVMGSAEVLFQLAAPLRKVKLLTLPAVTGRGATVVEDAEDARKRCDHALNAAAEYYPGRVVAQACQVGDGSFYRANHWLKLRPTLYLSEL